MRLSHYIEKLLDVKGRGKAVQIGDWLEMGHGGKLLQALSLPDDTH